MKKWMKKITALSVASMTVFGLGTMSLLNVKAASPVMNLNTPAKIKTINLQQFLIANTSANIPATYISYTISGGEAVAAKDNGGTYQVFSGTPTSDSASTSPVLGTPTIGTVDTAFTTKTVYTTRFTGDEVKNTKLQSTTNAITGDTISDNVSLSDTQCYIKENVPIDFSTVTFNEPGIYRYIVTANAVGPVSYITATPSPFSLEGADDKGVVTKYLDVYVTAEQFSTTLKVSQYILRDSLTGTDKVAGFVCNYKTMDLDISHIVSGNQARDSQYFEGEIIFQYIGAGYKFNVTTTSDLSDTSLNTTGVYTTVADPTATGSSRIKFDLKATQHCIIHDVPIGVSVRVYENSLSKTGYTASVNSVLSTVNYANEWAPFSDKKYIIAGQVAQLRGKTNTVDTIVIELHKDGTIPTGIIVTVVPYATVAVAGFAGLIFLIRRKKSKDDKGDSEE